MPRILIMNAGTAQMSGSDLATTKFRLPPIRPRPRPCLYRSTLFQEVNGGAEPERRRQLVTHPHSADIPIVYPISVFGSSTPPTPRQLELCPCCCRRILGPHAVFGSAICINVLINRRVARHSSPSGFKSRDRSCEPAWTLARDECLQQSPCRRRAE